MKVAVRNLVLGFMAVAVAGGVPARAESINIGFTPLSNNSPYANTVASQFNVEVQMVLGSSYEGLNNGLYDTMVAFTFSNTGSMTANISELYWNWGTPVVLDPTPPAPGGFYYDPNGDSWNMDPGPGNVNPANLPGGNGIGFVADAAADQGSQPGISKGESATFFMGLVSGAGWNDVSGALYEGLINFGLHVRSINGGTSDAFVSVTPVLPPDPNDNIVPVPGAAGLGLAGLVLVGILRRKTSAERN